MRAVPAAFITLILVAVLCITHLPVTMASTQSSTLITVEIMPNGDAVWTTEKKVQLNTTEDIEAWDASAAQGTDKYRSQFEASISEYVKKIGDYLDRNMTVSGVDVSLERSQPYSMTGSNYSIVYGVLRYKFTWTNFGYVDGDIIEIGDAFADGFILNREDTIKFILPRGYEATAFSPAADEFVDSRQQHLIWKGDSVNNTNTEIRLFLSDEPGISIHKKLDVASGSIDWMMVIPVALLAAIAGFGSAFLIFRNRQRPVEIPHLEERRFEEPDELEPEDAPAVVSEPSQGMERFMSDEERIVRYLEEAGGQMFQSDLVKKTEFSKSKLSMVLSDLKEKGVIIKIKKGKENLIRLNRPSVTDNTNENDI